MASGNNNWGTDTTSSINEKLLDSEGNRTSKELLLDVFSRWLESEPFSWEMISHECHKNIESYKLRCDLVVENCTSDNLENKNIERLLVLLNCFDLQKSSQWVMDITKLKVSVLTWDYTFLSNLIKHKLNNIDTQKETSLLNILDIQQILTIIVEIFFVCSMDPLKKDSIASELLEIEKLCAFKAHSLQSNLEDFSSITYQDIENFKIFIHNTITYCETILFFGISTNPNQSKALVAEKYQEEKSKLKDLQDFFSKNQWQGFNDELMSVSRDRFERNYVFLNTYLDLLYLKFKERTLFNVDCNKDVEQYNIEDIYNDQQKSIKVLFQSYSKVAWYEKWSEQEQNIEQAIYSSYVVWPKLSSKDLIEETDSKGVSIVASTIFDDFVDNLEKDYIYIGELYLVVNSIVHFVNFHDEKLVKNFQNKINLVLQKKQIQWWWFTYPYASFWFTDALVDISTDSKKMMKLLEKITITDSLTKLYNRKMFEQDFNKYASYVLRHSSEDNFIPNKWIFALDIDNFKSINDTYWHWVWDIVLKEFANIVNDIIRTEDTLYRIGWEEFNILCECWTKDKAIHFAQKILKWVELNLANKMRQLWKFPKDWNDTITLSIWWHNLVHSVSTELWVIQEVGEFVNEVNDAADQVLYYSKNTWRNKVTFSDDKEYVFHNKNLKNESKELITSK